MQERHSVVGGEGLTEAGESAPQPPTLSVQVREARLELIGHVVERGSESSELVAPAYVHALGAPALGDRTRGVREAAQRAQDRPPFQIRDEGDDDEADQETAEQPVATRRVGGVDLRLGAEDRKANGADTRDE